MLGLEEARLLWLSKTDLICSITQQIILFGQCLKFKDFLKHILLRTTIWSSSLIFCFLLSFGSRWQIMSQSPVWILIQSHLCFLERSKRSFPFSSILLKLLKQVILLLIQVLLSAHFFNFLDPIDICFHALWLYRLSKLSEGKFWANWHFKTSHQSEHSFLSRLMFWMSICLVKHESHQNFPVYVLYTATVNFRE